MRSSCRSLKANFSYAIKFRVKLSCRIQRRRSVDQIKNQRRLSWKSKLRSLKLKIWQNTSRQSRMKKQSTGKNLTNTNRNFGSSRIIVNSSTISANQSKKSYKDFRRPLLSMNFSASVQLTKQGQSVASDQATLKR